jgi:hypothetical protein
VGWRSLLAVGCFDLPGWLLLANNRNLTSELRSQGRTETVRSLSIESAAFVDAMLSSDASPAERVAKLSAAADKHASLYKHAMVSSRDTYLQRKLLHDWGILVIVKRLCSNLWSNVGALY